MSEPEIVVVVAAARNGVIGRDGDLPWRISSDLKHFKATTMGLPMIMGRRTWASIGKALPGRTTIVVSRDPAFAAEGALTATSLEAALDRARAVAAASGAGVIAVVGGGEIYRQALASADRIELTEVDLEPPLAGAVTFPALDPAEWVETARVAGARGAKDEADFAFVTLRRRR
ncbi:MAG: dihydrofolate reductase [Siculibacillus sp.]